MSTAGESIGRSIAAVFMGYLVMAVAIMALFALWFRDPATVPSTGFLALTIAVGALAAVAGGFVAALLAGRAELGHACALALIAVAAGLVFMLLPASAAAGAEDPLWYEIANLAAVAVGAPLGGWLCARRERRSEEEANPMIVI